MGSWSRPSRELNRGIAKGHIVRIERAEYCHMHWPECRYALMRLRFAIVSGYQDNTRLCINLTMQD